MNKLSLEERAKIVACLCEGNSMRATTRLTGCAKKTVERTLREVGAACLDYQDAALVHLPCERVQCDEIWSFVYSKQKTCLLTIKAKRVIFGLG
jgi:lambda repressor-like predicted transcriptional regulator